QLQAEQAPRARASDAGSVQAMSCRCRFWVLCLATAALGCWGASDQPSRMAELVQLLADNVAEEITAYRHTHDPDNFYRSNFTSVAARIASMRNPCFTYGGVRECYPAFFLTGVPKGARPEHQRGQPSLAA